MRHTAIRLPSILAALALVTGCAGTPEAPVPVDVPSPAGPRSGEPFLFTDEGNRVHMSWIEKASDSTHAVRYARMEGDTWGPVRTIAERSDFFVNWADFPSVTVAPSGRLFVHWLQRRGPGRYSYDVRFAQSVDEGATWIGGDILHRDGKEAEHGFVAVWNSSADSVGVAWLDGRDMPAGHGDGGASGGAMRVMSTLAAADGGRAAEISLDTRSCECCQVNAAMTSQGPVVVYRDRSDSEIRDIAIVRQTGGAWTPPAMVHNDGWQIAACPVNGPAIKARADTVVVAWFTGARDTAKVLVAWSFDAGATFAAPARIDAGTPAGRVDLALLGDGSAAVSWLERVDSTSAQVLLRRVLPDGTIRPHTVVATTTGSRASGFPRITLRGSDLVAAWTVTGDTARVRLARLDVARLP